MKILSLFDGISCARVALDRAKIPVDAYYASEIDKYAIQISQNMYPDIIQIGDVKDIKYQYFNKRTLGKIDLLIGGSPCQDLSIAKKDRKGLDGVRSGLFWEYVRILREVKPKYFILENVASMSKEAKEIITRELGVEPIMINAALVSAQNRKRLFWTNIPNVTLPDDRGILLKDILETEVDEKYNVYSDNWRVARNTVDINNKSRYLNASNYKGALNDGMSLIRIGQIGKGGQGDRIYSPEGKSVALSAHGGGRGAKTGLYVQPVALRNRGNGKQPEYNGTGKANAMTTVQTDSMVAIIPEATKKGYAIAHDGDSVDISFPNSKTRRGRVGNKAKNIMTSANVGVFKNGIIRKLTPIECERLQGLPDNYTSGVSNSQRYKALGNAFNVDVIAHILSFIKKS